jgi:hypothetical protein
VRIGILTFLSVWLLAHGAVAQTHSRESDQRLTALTSLYPVRGQDELTYLLYSELLVVGEQGGDGQTSRRGMAGLSLGAELLHSDDFCELLRVGAAARGELSKTFDYSWETWGNSCVLHTGLPLPWLEFGHHLEVGARPALSAMPELAARPFNRERLQLQVGLLELFDKGDVNSLRFQFGVSDIDLSFEWGEPFTELQMGMGVDFDMIRLFRPRRTPYGRVDMELAFFPVVARARARTFSTMTVRASLVRLRGVRLGSGDLYLDADAAFAHGSVSGRVTSTDEGSSSYVETSTFAGDLALRAGLGSVFGRLGLSRSVLPGFDELIVEDRASLSGRIESDLLDAELAAFATRTVVGRPHEQVETHHTGGLELRAARRLGGPFYLTALVEGSRSFYARLDDSLHPSPAWILRGQLSLTTALEGELGGHEDP